MRTLLMFLLFTSVLVDAYAQQTVTPLIDNEIHPLNGGVRGSMGGRSRITLPIRVPQNAVAIIYTVQANRQGLSIEDDFNLSASLMSYMGVAVPLAAALSKVHIPSSTQAADAYILPTTRDKMNFENKIEGQWKVISDISRQACESCVVTIPCNANDWGKEVYLGIRNPSALDPVTVKVNVVAVLAE